jgi:hypothetical protein
MSSEALRTGEDVVRQQLPPIAFTSGPLQFRYHRGTNVLTVLTGRQDRSARRVLDTGDATVYLDADNRPIRVEFGEASFRFPRPWLQRHERWPVH